MPATSPLPPELLVIIFQNCVSRAHDYDGLSWQFHICNPRCLLDWIQVTHVCRQWRAVALGSPKLWSRPVMNCGRWTEEMISRSGSAQLSLAVRIDYVADRQIEIFRRAKQLVLYASLQPLLTILRTLNLRQTSSLHAMRLESLSLKRAFDDNTWSEADPTADFLLANASTLNRLHLDSLSLPLRRSFFDGMSNLQELSLQTFIGSLGHPSEPPIHLPRLVRLHLINDINTSKHLLASLHHSNPLEYLGLHDPRVLSQLSGTLSTFRDMVLGHHAIGQHNQHAHAPLDLEGYHCALAISTRRLMPGQSMSGHSLKRVTYNLAAWSTKVIDVEQLVSRIAREWPPSILPRNATMSPEDVSVLLDSSPAMFIGGIHRISGVDHEGSIVSQFSTYFSLRSVVSMIITDAVISSTSITHGSIISMFSHVPFLQYLEASGSVFPTVIEALYPTGSSSNVEVPVARLSQLVLSSTQHETYWGGRLVSCIRSRAAQGHSLKKLSIRGRMTITTDEWRALKELPLSLKRDDPSYS